MIKEFKGIWMPVEIYECTDLKILEKFFLVEIMSLDKSNRCFASNGYFAEFFNISKGRTSVIINKLLKRGYVTIEYIRINGNLTVAKRIIKPTRKVVVINNKSDFI